MSIQNRSYYFVEAKDEDGAEILEILEQPDFSGDLSIIYTRRPNPFLSFQSEGKDVLVLLCRDKDTHELMGFGTCSIRTQYIKNAPEQVGYLSGLRIKKKFRKMTFLLIDAYENLIEWIKKKGISLVYTTVLNDNSEVQKMFEKKRKRFPHYIPISDYTVYCATTKIKRTTSSRAIEKATSEDIDEILCFLKENNAQNDLFPVLTKDDLLGKTYLKLDITKYYIAKDEKNCVVACAYCWNQKENKQHIMHKYGGKYTFLKYVSSFLPLIGYPKLPKEGHVLEYYTVSYYAYKEGHIHELEAIVQAIAANNSQMSYFLMGVAANMELHNLMGSLAKITYGSKVYAVDYIKNNESAKMITDLDQIYIECGML